MAVIPRHSPVIHLTGVRSLTDLRIFEVSGLTGQLIWRDVCSALLTLAVQHYTHSLEDDRLLTWVCTEYHKPNHPSETPARPSLQTINFENYFMCISILSENMSLYRLCLVPAEPRTGSRIGPSRTGVTNTTYVLRIEPRNSGSATS